MDEKKPAFMSPNIENTGSESLGVIIDDLSNARQRALEYQDHIKNNPNMAREAKKLNGCANFLIFHHYYTKGEIKLASARTCKQHLICPFCARGRGQRAYQLYRERYDYLVTQEPDLIPAMLTLTVKNGPNLSERFEHLTSNFKKAMHRRRNKNSISEFKKIHSAVFSYEFTKSDHGWHPHIHCLVLLKGYIDQKNLSREWLKFTGDSSVVDIRKVDEGVFAEVFKYALKFSDLSNDDLTTSYQTLKTRRLLGSFGGFRGIQLPDSPLDDLLDFQGLPFLELKHVYRRRYGHYEFVTMSHRSPNAQGNALGNFDCLRSVARFRETFLREMPKPPPLTPLQLGKSRVEPSRLSAMLSEK